MVGDVVSRGRRPSRPSVAARLASPRARGPLTRASAAGARDPDAPSPASPARGPGSRARTGLTRSRVMAPQPSLARRARRARTSPPSRRRGRDGRRRPRRRHRWSSSGRAVRRRRARVLESSSRLRGRRRGSPVTLRRGHVRVQDVAVRWSRWIIDDPGRAGLRALDELLPSHQRQHGPRSPSPCAAFLTEPGPLRLGGAGADGYVGATASTPAEEMARRRSRPVALARALAARPAGRPLRPGRCHHARAVRGASEARARGRARQMVRRAFLGPRTSGPAPFIRNWMEVLCFLLSGAPASGTLAAEIRYMFDDWYRRTARWSSPWAGATAIAGRRARARARNAAGGWSSTVARGEHPRGGPAPSTTRPRRGARRSTRAEGGREQRHACGTRSILPAARCPRMGEGGGGDGDVRVVHALAAESTRRGSRTTSDPATSTSRTGAEA